ncbi:MAG: T9SS type A sorting domain-containing protein, partial [Bacteroidota bacterium]
INGGASSCGLGANDSASFFIGTRALGNAAFVVTGNDLVANLDVAMRGTGSSNSFFAPGNKSLSVTINNTPPVFNVNSSATAALEITQENARPNFTGLTFYSTPTLTNTTATVTLEAVVYDISTVAGITPADVDSGDIRYASVTFVNRATGAIIASNLPLTLVQAGRETIGYASFSFPVTVGTNDNAAILEVSTIVNGYYTYNNGSDITLITVAKPASNFISGGGFIYLTNPGGSQSADIGTKNNFAFSVKFNKRLTNLIGNVNFIIRKVESDGIEHTYQIKGNNLQSLAINPADSSAQLTGKANVQDITDPNNVIGLLGNANFSLKVDDNGNPGVNNDRFWVNLIHQGNLWYVSNAFGTLQTLDGGNIKVSISSGARVASDNLEGGTVLGQNFPNPASDHTSITFSIPEDGEALLQVFGQRGELLQQIDSREYAGGMIHRLELDLQHLAPGNYFYRLITNDEVLTRTFTVIR